MLRHFIMRAFLCFAAPSLCSQTALPSGPEEVDSLHILLGEVSVVAKNVIPKTDRKVIIPTKSKIQSCSSSLELLHKLTLPGISVNQLTGKISLTSGGHLKLFIDGVPATESRIAALDPENILRIEYHDNPGVRYADYDAVIDIILRKKDTGGRLFLESLDCIGDGKYATLNEAALQLHRGRSSWAVNASYVRMQRDNWIRDYEEIWRYPSSREVIRIEKGLPVKVGMSMLSTDVSYQYARNQSNVFNAGLSLRYDYSPYKEEGDRHSLLATSESSQVTEIREHTSEKSLSPTLTLNYRHTFTDAGSLNFNIEGSWLNTSSTRTYSESMEKVAVCNLMSETDGHKYGIFAEGLHEMMIGPGRLASGLRYTLSHTSNDYRLDKPDNAATTNINQSESSIFSEYSLLMGAWGLTGGIAGKDMHVSQAHHNLTEYSLLPQVALSFSPNSDIFFRYSFRLGRKLPPLASLSDISQEIQAGMIRRGNPSAKPFSFSSQHFTFSYGTRFISINMALDYLNELKPVMNSVVYEDGIFVQTYGNQKYFRKLHGEVMIAVNPLGSHLTLWISPNFTRYFSRGKNYNITKNITLIHFGADATYKRFIFTASTMSGPDNYMYGDVIIKEKPMNMILAGYKAADWTLQAGVFNLMKTYWMKTENFSPLTPFKSTAHCGKNTYFTVKISLNLKFGKQRSNPDDSASSRASHLDMDSGIVTGFK